MAYRKNVANHKIDEFYCTFKQARKAFSQTDF
jgi:hypothetical protein